MTSSRNLPPRGRAIATSRVADFKSERPRSNRNRWPPSFRNQWLASSGISSVKRRDLNRAAYNARLARGSGLGVCEAPFALIGKVIWSKPVRATHNRTSREVKQRQRSNRYLPLSRRSLLALSKFWGINSNHDIFRFNGQTFAQVTIIEFIGTLEQIIVGAGNAR